MRYVGTITAALEGEFRSPMHAGRQLWELMQLTDTVLDLTDETGQRFLVNLATNRTFPIVADRKRDTLRRVAWASIGCDCGWDALLTGRQYLLGLASADVGKLISGHGALAELLHAQGLRVQGVHRRSGDTRFVTVSAWQQMYDPNTGQPVS